MEELYYKSAIGSDEVGTGELFRPQVYVSCFVSNCQLLALEQLGVTDSKKLTRKKCCEIAEQLIKMVEYEVYILDNEKLNQIYKKIDNLNKIKAISHSFVIRKLYNRIEKYYHIDAIVIDKFCTADKFKEYIEQDEFYDDFAVFIEKGELAHLAVACASIIATYFQEIRIKELEEELGLELPGGNTTKAKDFVKIIYSLLGEQGLEKYAKMNFRTVQINEEALT